LAAGTGVREEVIILQAGSTPVNHPKEVAEAITDAESKDRRSVIILVKRSNNSLFIAIPLS
tara:strand:+ start:48 stop:230 length:183 start_codon:yes stop_codon:yes gene_type:complete